MCFGGITLRARGGTQQSGSSFNDEPESKIPNELKSVFPALSASKSSHALHSFAPALHVQQDSDCELWVRSGELKRALHFAPIAKALRSLAQTLSVKSRLHCEPEATEY